MYKSIENSLQDGKPIELYSFTYNGVSYNYTSAQYTQSLTINGKDMVFSPEYIIRSDSLKLMTTSNEETCKINVLRTNSIALLYQGAPPEFGQVEVKVYRYHEEDNDYIEIIAGSIRQVSFDDSEAELTIAIDNILKRNIPRGKLSYFCQNMLYDERCGLKMEDWQTKCWVDRFVNNLFIYSTNLREKESGYFTDGLMKMGNSYRKIVKHENDMIQIKYPLSKASVRDNFVVAPGCSCLFGKCARVFHNHANFSGIPYTPPYDVYNHNSYKTPPPYWEDTSIVTRDSHGKIYSMNL